jgi:hypothetical protein
MWLTTMHVRLTTMKMDLTTIHDGLVTMDMKWATVRQMSQRNL